MANSSYEVLKVERVGAHVVHVQLNRPKKGNAMNKAFWEEYRQCFVNLAADPDCRSIVVSGAGKFFTVGLDLMDFGAMMGGESSDVARKAWHMRQMVLQMQDTFTAMERCPQPVIVAAHNAVIGGGIDLLCAADIRLCSQDAFFCIKEGEKCFFSLSTRNEYYC